MQDYFLEEDRSLYDRLSYTSIEISPKLAALQRKRVGEQHASSFRTTIADACGAAAWGPPSREPCFILMMEVLDNLPHDRQVCCSSWRAPDICMAPAMSLMANHLKDRVVSTLCTKMLVVWTQASCIWVSLSHVNYVAGRWDDLLILHAAGTAQSGQNLFLSLSQ